MSWAQYHSRLCSGQSTPGSQLFDGGNTASNLVAKLEAFISHARSTNEIFLLVAKVRKCSSIIIHIH